MDERQTQITEGAGLEESRVNQELVEFLNKWSFPVLLIIAIVSGGYFLFNKWEQRKLARRDDAFAQLGSVESSPNPSVFSLTGIADEFEGVGSVSELALLRAAGIHLNAVRSGLDPADPEAELSEDDIAFHREQAGTLYGRVADRTAGDPDRGLFAINAAFGLAAVSESEGDLELARERYAQAGSLATENGFASLAIVAEDLGRTVGETGEITLYQASDFPRLPFEPEPVPLETTIDVIEDTTAGPAAPEDSDLPIDDDGSADGDDADAGSEDGTEADGTGDGSGTDPSDG